MKGIFYDNVRAFQGDENEVNTEISETIKSYSPDLFVLLNNGITIVAGSVLKTGDKFTIEDFQVVNGCQTCHVIYNNRNENMSSIFVSLKIIVSQNSVVRDRVIKATNRQTVVKKEELIAITDFQKELESYYAAQPSQYILYYERRSKQYAFLTNIEKVRIISIPLQIKAFSSMFLDHAHLSGRYYTKLFELVQEKIFLENHKTIAYYISAYASYKIDYLIRNKQISREYSAFKYAIIMSINLYYPSFNTMHNMQSNKFDKHCNLIKEILWDDDECIKMIREIISKIDVVSKKVLDRGKAKTKTFMDELKAQFNPKP